MRQPPSSNPNSPSTLGERIRFAREKLGITQQALGTASGTSRALVSQWEAGIRNPGVRSLNALRGPLNVTLEWLVSGGEPNKAFDPEPQVVTPLVPKLVAPTGQSFNDMLLRAATEVVIEIFKRRRLKLDPVSVGKAVSLVYEIGVIKGLDRPKATIQALKRSLSEAAEHRLRGA